MFPFLLTLTLLLPVLLRPLQSGQCLCGARWTRWSCRTRRWTSCARFRGTPHPRHAGVRRRGSCPGGGETHNKGGGEGWLLSGGCQHCLVEIYCVHPVLFTSPVGLRCSRNALVEDTACLPHCSVVWIQTRDWSSLIPALTMGEYYNCKTSSTAFHSCFMYSHMLLLKPGVYFVKRYTLMHNLTACRHRRTGSGFLQDVQDCIMLKRFPFKMIDLGLI